jgi:TRAP-type mannitol/chloroaromatic compound transport system substrate-binding protein
LLPKHYQAILTAAAFQAGEWLTSKFDHLNPPAIRRLVAAGAQLRVFSPDLMEAAWHASNETYAELSQANPRFKKLHDSLMDFRNNSYQWWQVCELPFDSFQVRMRRT